MKHAVKVVSRDDDNLTVEVTIDGAKATVRLAEGTYRADLIPGATIVSWVLDEENRLLRYRTDTVKDDEAAERLLKALAGEGRGSR